jgi:hypothetical protein
MPASASSRYLRPPTFNQTLGCHPRIGKKSRKTNNATASATRQTAKTDTLPPHHTAEQKTPLFPNRASPKSPKTRLSPKVITNPATVQTGSNQT